MAATEPLYVIRKDATTNTVTVGPKHALGTTTVHLDDPTLHRTWCEFVLREAQRVNLANVYPSGAITRGREGLELAGVSPTMRRNERVKCD